MELATQRERVGRVAIFETETSKLNLAVMKDVTD
jgi:hypothetical protein